MKHVRTRGLSALVALFFSAVFTLGIPLTGSAATPQTINIAWMSIHASEIATVQNVVSLPFTVNMFAWQANRGAHGYIFVNDPVKEIAIVGSIDSLTPISYGYHFEGCGQAFGPLHGDVCFAGDGSGDPVNYFSITVTSGVTYSANGYFTAGDIKSNNTVSTCSANSAFSNC